MENTDLVTHSGFFDLSLLRGNSWKIRLTDTRLLLCSHGAKVSPKICWQFCLNAHFSVDAHHDIQQMNALTHTRLHCVAAHHTCEADAHPFVRAVLYTCSVQRRIPIFFFIYAVITALHHIVGLFCLYRKSRGLRKPKQSFLVYACGDVNKLPVCGP